MSPTKRTRRRRSPTGDEPSVETLIEFVQRYVVMSDAQTLIVVLWAIHTHCFHVFEQSPYLAVTSPEKQCGKSRLLETLELLVARPWMAVLPSEAVVYRTIEAKKPTLLLDEVDTIFNPRSQDKYEGLRAVLNSGHRRSAKVPRCVGTSMNVVEFSVFCPKVLAGIGTLPDTVADRSIPIRLQRRRRDEPVERFFRRKAEAVADPLREELAEWAKANRAKLAKARPRMPGELSDRMIDGCEPLVAIADRLGVGPAARAALVEVLGGERLDDEESLRLRLLEDLRTIWTARERKKDKPIRGIRTTALITDLYAIEDGPWAYYYNRGFESRDLAKFLRHYGIAPKPLRIPGGVVKGYKRDDLQNGWARYLP